MSSDAAPVDLADAQWIHRALKPLLVEHGPENMSRMGQVTVLLGDHAETLAAAVDRLMAERDTARDVAVSLESMVHEARADAEQVRAEQVRAELAETAAISLALKLEVERLGAALTRYGRHASTCVPSRENPCTCGFKAALEGPK